MNAITAEILIQSYYTPDYRVGGLTVTEKEGLDYLCKTELVTLDTKTLVVSITDRGQCLVKYWLDCPLPIASWSMEVSR